MFSDDISCPTEEYKEANIRVLRKVACAFPAEVKWSAKDKDAKYGKHYKAQKGLKNFFL